MYIKLSIDLKTINELSKGNIEKELFTKSDNNSMLGGLFFISDFCSLLD